MKLKLNTGPSQPPTPAGDAPAQTPGGTGLKLKLGGSKPPISAVERAPTPSFAAPTEASKKKRTYPPKSKNVALKAGTKRAANEDLQSPTVKRIASEAGPQRKFSIKLGNSARQEQSEDDLAPPSAASQSADRILKLKLGNKPKPQPKRTSGVKNLRVNVKGQAPPRIPGNGYDSEDSEREPDPAKEQQLILRMQPGEDCDYLRDAITERKLGVLLHEGGAEVSFKFISRDLRRAVINIRGRMYAAALVDLPTIVETMKSWDKKGWWKVADISQMLLVLGRCSSEDEAKNYSLPPRVVNSQSMQYAHGITPPMHWVRKRRFRKRVTYKSYANVEEEVEKLLKDDEEAERFNGTSTFEIYDRASIERSLEPQQQQQEAQYEDQYGDEDAEGEAVSTIEDGQGAQEYDFNFDDDAADPDDMEAMLAAGFAEDHVASDQPPGSDMVVESPAPMADQAQSFAQAEAGTMSDSAAETPAQATETQDEESDYDEDDDDDADSPDVFDEDAQAKAAQQNQALQQVNDAEYEVNKMKDKIAGLTNQLLIKKNMPILRDLENDLRMKRLAAGMDVED